MAEPISTKTGVAILGVLGIAATSFAGDWLMVALGSVIGATLQISRSDAFPAQVVGWGQQIKLWLILLWEFSRSVMAGLLFSRLVAALWMKDPEVNEYILAGLAGVIAFGWRRLLPKSIDRIAGAPQQDQPK